MQCTSVKSGDEAGRGEGRGRVRSGEGQGEESQVVVWSWFVLIHKYHVTVCDVTVQDPSYASSLL